MVITHRPRPENLRPSADKAHAMFSGELSSVEITAAGESCHPLCEPAQWAGGYSDRWLSDARALRPGGGFHLEAEGRKRDMLSEESRTWN
jgi:hypothetical protein